MALQRVQGGNNNNQSSISLALSYRVNALVKPGALSFKPVLCTVRLSTQRSKTHAYTPHVDRKGQLERHGLSGPDRRNNFASEVVRVCVSAFICECSSLYSGGSQLVHRSEKKKVLNIRETIEHGWMGRKKRRKNPSEVSEKNYCL